MRKNAISNKIFHGEYFYDIVWRDFACQVIFTGQLRNPWQMPRIPVENHCLMHRHEQSKCKASVSAAEVLAKNQSSKQQKFIQCSTYNLKLG